MFIVLECIISHNYFNILLHKLHVGRIDFRNDIILSNVMVAITFILVSLLFSFQKVGIDMKEISIRFKTKSELSYSDYFPFVITIDGVEQKNIKRFAIDLSAENKNIESNFYTIEKFMEYPKEYISE